MAVLSFGEIPRQHSIAKIKDGCDILISTVGRLCDYLQNKVVSRIDFGVGFHSFCRS